jgi:hypothetical protein
VLASPKPPCKDRSAIDARTEEALIGEAAAAAAAAAAASAAAAPSAASALAVWTFCLVAAARRGNATSPIVAESPARTLTGTFANQNGVVSLFEVLGREEQGEQKKKKKGLRKKK